MDMYEVTKKAGDSLTNDNELNELIDKIAERINNEIMERYINIGIEWKDYPIKNNRKSILMVVGI